MRLMIVLGLIYVFFVFPGNAFSAQTVLMMQGDSGDWIGRGSYYFYSQADGTFDAQRNIKNGASISFHTPDYSVIWSLDFAAANNQLLTAGKYAGATRYPFQDAGVPGLSVSGDGRGCNTVLGSFEIREINYGPNDEIISFWAAFEQHCEGAVPALRGEILYNADAPNTVTLLQSSSNPVMAGSPVTFSSTVGGIGSTPTGTVTVYDGPTILGTSVVSGSPAIATVTTSSLSIGPHAITAVYGGDADSASSRSAVLNENVQGAGSTVLMMTSDAGDYIGQGLYYFYSLSDGTFSGNGSPKTAVISFRTPGYNHYWNLSFASPTNGSLSVGTYLGAQRFASGSSPGLEISGDGRGCNGLTGNFEIKEISYGPNNAILSFWAAFEQHCEGGAPALKGEIRFNANAPNTVTVIKSSANPTSTGSSVTYTATVGRSGGTPTGTVMFRGGSNILGTGTLSGTPATVSLTTSSLSPGTHAVVAVYEGDTNSEASSSAALFQLVQPAGATLLMMTSEKGDWVGNGAFYLYSLADGNFTAQRNVSNGVSIHFLTIDNSPWTLDFVAPKDIPFEVGYYPGATRYPFQNASDPGLSIDGNFHGCNVLAGNFTVREISYGPNNDIFSFWAAFEQHCEGMTPALRGEIRFNANAPNSVTLIKSSQNPSVFGGAITLSATVGGVGNIPSGSVTFMEGATVLGTGILYGSPANVEFTTSSLIAGSHPIIAVYEGDTNFVSSDSVPLYQSVQALLTVNKAGTGSGVVISSPVGINCPTICSAAYDANTFVTLTAAADAATSVFDSWSGCDTVNGNTCTVTMNNARTVTASFKLLLDPCADAVTRCNDNNACTTDTCEAGTGVCGHIPIFCDDNNPCTIDTCDPVTGCIHAAITGCNASGIITTVAGNGTAGYSGDNGPATYASLQTPSGVTIDSSGNIYIADYGNHCIRKVDTAGTITTLAGNGLYGYFGDNGPAISARLYYPSSIVVDTLGNIYIADTFNNRIRKIDTSGIITTVVGNGMQGYSGDNGPALSASLNRPANLGLDVSGNLYIADSGNNRIRKMNTAGIITTVAGNGIGGYSGDNGPAISASLYYPTGVILDALGNIYIADYKNARVRKIDAGGTITTKAGNGTYGYSGDNGPAILASFSRPTYLALDFSGNIYISDSYSHHIRKVDTGGTVTTVAGNGIAGYSGDNGPAISASLYWPSGVAVDSLGQIYIGDYGNNRIRKVTGLIVPSCTGQPDGTPCNDNNACTSNDVCSNGTCVGTPIVCSNHNACTIGDICLNGTCLPGTPLNCDDGNACTTDTCDPAIGCVHTDNNCSDNNPCTIDTCDTVTGACVHTPGSCPSPLPNGTTLSLDPGQGSTQNVPCATGSCFGIELSPGLVLWTDFAPGMDGGLIIGKDQQPGSTTGGSEMGDLSDAWNFFQNWGTFATAPFCATDAYGLKTCVTTNASENVFDNASCTDAASCAGKTTLGTWHVSWNGVAVPMGMSPSCLSTSPANCIGVTQMVYSTGTAAVGSTYQLDYAWAVPNNDPSGFGNVPFYLTLRGTVTAIVYPCSDAATRCNDNKPCTNDLCDPVTGACLHVNAPNGTACNDNNACTVNDVCSDGVCVGTPSSGQICNDGNVCTVNDVCTDGVCVGTPSSGQNCNDGNACTVNDVCSNGVCAGTPMNCDDGDACTVDACTAGACIHAMNCRLPGCSTDPRCLPRPLPNGSKLLLDPGVGSGPNTPCATGSCFGMFQGAGLVLWTDFGPGTDGGIVLGKDQQPGSTFGGSEMGELSDAWGFFGAPGTFATAPFCATGFGGTTCVTSISSANTFDNASCYDAAGCLGKTTLGTWHASWNGVAVPLGSALGCLSTSPENCGGVSLWTLNPDPATTGSVFELNYVWAVPNNDPSGFGNVPFYLHLRGTAEIYDPCANAATRCNDNNICTTDTCNSSTGACGHVNNTLACDDNNVCTVNDVCSDGVCVGTPSSGQICNDGNVCTVNDVCTDGVCVGTPSSGQICNDGNACTVNDVCSNGVCAGTPMNCDDGDACTVDACTAGVCIHAMNCRLPGCSTDPRCLPRPLPNGSLLALDPGSGSAANVPCATGSCFGIAQGPGLVLWIDFAPGLDGGIVLGKDQQPGSLVGGTEMGDLSDAWNFFQNWGTFATAPFTGGSAGAVTTGSSANTFDDMSCTDAASCLNKTTLGTWHVSWNGVAVPMGSALGCLTTTPSNCIGVTSLVWDGGAGPALTGSTFELDYAWAVPDGDPSGFGNVPFYLILRGSATVVDLCADAATRCNDGNACTTDTCDPVTGACTHTNVVNGTTCTLTNKCLVSPTCTNGICGGTPKVCNDNNPCTTDSCTTSTGLCKFTGISGGTCNDGNACTLNDTCVSGVCKGTPKNCSDNNVCTTDTCDTATGVCTSTPGPATCGLACDPTTAPGMALLQNGSVLRITQGVGSAINTPCSVGSCFSMETAPGVLFWTDFGPGTDGGIVVGKSQKSGGQETGPSNTNNTPGELSNAWFFFNAYGTFYTAPDGGTKNIYCNTSCTGADCIYKTELKVFNVAWNGNIIPMGSEGGCTQWTGNCSPAETEGIYVKSYTIDPIEGGAWSMNYAQVVPTGSFTGVRFTAIMRGTVHDPCAGVVCTALDQCHDAGICTAGVCSNPNKTNGTSCDDGNACTTSDICTAGVCGGTQKVCIASDQCHLAGICDPATGICNNPTAPNGTICSDGNACTVSDTCSGGVCVAGTPKSCDDGNCCTTDSCDSATGACVNSAIPGCGDPGNPLPNGTQLGFEMGVGSGAMTPCATGSCFGMEVAPAYVLWTDFGGGGFVVGKDQACGELSSAWSFFGADGTFGSSSANKFDSASCTGLECVGKTELNVFNVCWNGLTIPMGSRCGVNDYQVDPVDGGAWSMNYSSAVPQGDPSGMGGVRFSMIVRGTLTMDPCRDAATRCNDNNACTIEGCENATGACVHTPVVIDDGNACTVDSCDPATGVKHTPINCDDNNACTSDGCNPTSGCYHMPIICNDNDACTIDFCNTATGCAFTPVVNGTPCPIGSCYAGGCYPPIGECGECVGDSQCPSNMRCDVGNGCYPSCDCLPGGPCPAVCTYHCVPGCNDNDLCTIDTYDPIKGCVFTPIMCNDNNTCTTDSCDPAVGICAYSPLAEGSPCILDSQAGACTAGQCIPYPACPAGSVKNVVVRGGGQKPSGADLQIQTSFTVMNAGCIVDSSASSITCTAGTILQINFSAGQGPNPTTATLQGNPIPTDTNLTITCTAGEVYKLDLDNRDAAGGKDVDRITITVQ